MPNNTKKSPTGAVAQAQREAEAKAKVELASLATEPSIEEALAGNTEQSTPERLAQYVHLLRKEIANRDQLVTQARQSVDVATQQLNVLKSGERRANPELQSALARVQTLDKQLAVLPQKDAEITALREELERVRHIPPGDMPSAPTPIEKLLDSSALRANTIYSVPVKNGARYEVLNLDEYGTESGLMFRQDESQPWVYLGHMHLARSPKLPNDWIMQARRGRR